MSFKIFNVGLGSEHISIKPHKFSNYIDYGGGTKPKRPKDYKLKKIGDIENPVHYMACILYGCLIQTIYLKSIKNYEFNDCFNPNDSANGKHDLNDFARTGFYFDGNKRKEVLEFIKNKYINRLENNKEHLEELFEISPLNFANDFNDEQFLDIESIRKSLKGFLNEHEEHYSFLIKNIEEIKTRDNTI